MCEIAATALIIDCTYAEYERDQGKQVTAQADVPRQCISCMHACAMIKMISHAIASGATDTTGSIAIMMPLCDFPK